MKNELLQNMQKLIKAGENINQSIIEFNKSSNMLMKQSELLLNEENDMVKIPKTLLMEVIQNIAYGVQTGICKQQIYDKLVNIIVDDALASENNTRLLEEKSRERYHSNLDFETNNIQNDMQDNNIGDEQKITAVINAILQMYAENVN